MITLLIFQRMFRLAMAIKTTAHVLATVTGLYAEAMRRRRGS